MNRLLQYSFVALLALIFLTNNFVQSVPSYNAVEDDDSNEVFEARYSWDEFTEDFKNAIKYLEFWKSKDTTTVITPVLPKRDEPESSEDSDSSEEENERRQPFPHIKRQFI